MRALLLFAALLFSSPALAVDFPPLTGRVVDQAELLSPDQEAQLTARLEALQRTSSRQLVVATVSSLQDLPVEDYGNGLFRAWRLGQSQANNGVLLLVAPNERKVRIEVGYGMEPIITDALSSLIIRDQILPRFRDNDYAGGIIAGSDALIRQLGAPPEAQEQAALAAQQAENRSKASGHRSSRGSSIVGAIIPFVIIFFFVLPAFGAAARGRRYRRGVSIWGPGYGGGSGLGWMLMGAALSNIGRGGGGGSSWGGGGGSWGGGGGGFSGGGGSSGGGGASGSW